MKEVMTERGRQWMRTDCGVKTS